MVSNVISDLERCILWSYFWLKKWPHWHWLPIYPCWCCSGLYTVIFHKKFFLPHAPPLPQTLPGSSIDFSSDQKWNFFHVTYKRQFLSLLLYKKNLNSMNSWFKHPNHDFRKSFYGSHALKILKCTQNFASIFSMAFVAVVAGLTIGDRSEQNRLIWRLQLAPAVLQNVYVEYFKGLMAFSRFFSGCFAVFKVDGLRPWRKLHLRLFSFTRLSPS